jgi:hypothetical protein
MSGDKIEGFFFFFFLVYENFGRLIPCFHIHCVWCFYLVEILMEAVNSCFTTHPNRNDSFLFYFWYLVSTIFYLSPTKYIQKYIYIYY